MKLALRTLSVLLASAATSTTASVSPTSLAGRAASVAFVNRSLSSAISNPSHKSKSSSVHKMSTTSAEQKQALISCPTIPLRDGTKHPAIGFGTYKVGFIPASASSAVAAGGAAADAAPQRTAEECVRDALEVGYRFLECAEFYGNESEVGKAIKASGVKREDLFLCSKVWTTTIEKGEVAIRARLDQSELDSVC